MESNGMGNDKDELRRSRVGTALGLQQRKMVRKYAQGT